MDVGADLKCPQTDETGTAYWSYGLIRAVWPGDLVFHYSTVTKEFVGASVAGGPLEERPITWVPHGTSGRAGARVARDQGRPGWWLPLYEYKPAHEPLRLEELQAPDEQDFIRRWIAARQDGGKAYAPFQCYPGRLRAAQGYLTKMPRAFVERWPKLARLEEELAPVEDAMGSLASFYPAPSSRPGIAGEFRPRDSSPYEALVRGGLQRRSRNHERLVEHLAEFLSTRGAAVSNPHPLDLLGRSRTNRDRHCATGVGALTGRARVRRCC